VGCYLAQSGCHGVPGEIQADTRADTSGGDNRRLPGIDTGLRQTLPPQIILVRQYYFHFM
jgi:hypothetical protein